MITLRLIQIALVLCLMASLLTAAPAACTCSHHEEAKAVKADCHSQHEAVNSTETVETGNAIDESCVCTVAQRGPLVASSSFTKDLKVSDPAAHSAAIATDFEFFAEAAFYVAPAMFRTDLSYSSTLRALLPARAPPRL